MRMTLLKMVQSILSSMDSDEVNSIGDTTESIQVVDAIEETYLHLISTIDFPDQWDFFELEHVGDVSQPTMLKVPDDVSKVEWIQYDCREDGETKRVLRPVSPLSRGEFFRRMNGLDTDQSDTYEYTFKVGAGTFEVRGKNNSFPNYYTTFDDNRVVFDNYRADINQTLVGNKTWCYGQRIPLFIRQDDFIPDLDPKQFTLLYNEAKAQCFVDLKQVENTRAERRARRGWVQSARKDPTVPDGSIHPSHFKYFGRHRRGR